MHKMTLVNGDVFSAFTCLFLLFVCWVSLSPTKLRRNGLVLRCGKQSYRKSPDAGHDLYLDIGWTTPLTFHQETSGYVALSRQWDRFPP